MLTAAFVAGVAGNVIVNAALVVLANILSPATAAYVVVFNTHELEYCHDAEVPFNAVRTCPNNGAVALDTATIPDALVNPLAEPDEPSIATPVNARAPEALLIVTAVVPI